METVTISLERYENMSKEIDRMALKLKKDIENLELSTKNNQELLKHFRLKELHLNNILKVLEERKVRVDLKPSGEVSMYNIL